MLDERAITKALQRYTRGADHRDVDDMRTAYWPDATDVRGEGGSATALLDTLDVRLARYERTMHRLTNIDIEVDGDVATVESYIRALHVLNDANGNPITIERNGRFLDRFERRNGEWRIAARDIGRGWVEQRTLDPETWTPPPS